MGSQYKMRVYKKGKKAMQQEVSKEAVEFVIEAKDNDPVKFKNEAADLLFHGSEDLSVGIGSIYRWMEDP